MSPLNWPESSISAAVLTASVIVDSRKAMPVSGAAGWIEEGELVDSALPLMRTWHRAFSQLGGDTS